MNIKKEDLKAIFIVAGHGKSISGDIKDNGAVSNGTTERREALEIAIDVIKNVKESNIIPNVRVYDVGVVFELDLIEKISEVNSICKKEGYTHKNSILVSIHLNSGGGKGVESWHYINSEESKTLGAYISDSVSKLVGINHRGDKDEKINRHGKLAIIHDTTPLACLIEASFIDNEEEANIFKDEIKDDMYGIAIANGIYNYLGITVYALPYDDDDISEDEDLILKSCLYQMKVLHLIGSKKMKYFAEKIGKQLRNIHPLLDN